MTSRSGLSALLLTLAFGLAGTTSTAHAQSCVQSSGTVETTFVNGQTQSLMKRVNLTGNCALPTVTVQSVSATIKCGSANGPTLCPHNPTSPNQQLLAHFTNVSTSGFDVYLTAPSGVWVGNGNLNFGINWTVNCSGSSCQFSSASSTSSASSIASGNGCVDIIAEAFDVNSNLMTPTAQFTFILADRTGQSDGNGRLRFDGLASGIYTAHAVVPSAWEQINVTPNSSQVQVYPGNTCSTIVFKLRQRTLATSSSSSSHSSKPRKKGDLLVSKEASASEVFPDGSIEYTVTIENDTGEDLVDLEIIDDYPEDSVEVTDDGDADEDEHGELIWFLDHLDDGDIETFTYRVRVDAAAQAGDELCNEVIVRAEGEEDPYEEEAEACVAVIDDLPQTGGRTIGGSTAFLRPMTAASEGNALPLGLWSTLLTLGISGGAAIGRKYFL